MPGADASKRPTYSPGADWTSATLCAVPPGESTEAPACIAFLSLPDGSVASTRTIPASPSNVSATSQFADGLARIVSRTTCAQNFPNPSQPIHSADQRFFASEVNAAVLPRP